MATDPLRTARVAAPCPVAWDQMEGDERRRHCSLCALNVYNFAEMTAEEARALLLKNEGRLCGRLYRRADGTRLTRDCPTGLRALRQRVFRVAAAIFAALLSVPSLLFAGKSCEKAQVKNGSSIELQNNQLTPGNAAILRGRITFGEGALPGVTVKLRNESTQLETILTTDTNGDFTFGNLPDGLYSLDATLDGMRPAGVEHLLLTSGDETVALFHMRQELMELGIIVLDEPTESSIERPGTTVITQELVDKLPE